ncbi:hypothetical protein G6F68_014777 [Rhizopus microsporus]|nr:hypothetical protein G6F68_014777 [Rhizopus microsporus]
MAAYANRRFLSPSVAEMLDRREQRRVTALSPREQEVGDLFTAGLSVAEIARKLDRKKQTVSTQKNNAMRKLGIERDAELLTFAADLGLKPQGHPAVPAALPAARRVLLRPRASHRAGRARWRRTARPGTGIALRAGVGDGLQILVAGVDEDPADRCRNRTRNRLRGRLAFNLAG